MFPIDIGTGRGRGRERRGEPLPAAGHRRDGHLIAPGAGGRLDPPAWPRQGARLSGAHARLQPHGRQAGLAMRGDPEPSDGAEAEARPTGP